MAPERLPSPGDRVLAFHPVARAWRPATVKTTASPDRVEVAFTFYADSEKQTGEVTTSEHAVRWPEEVEPLDPASDFLPNGDENDRARAWRAVLFSLTLADPRIHGERRAAKSFDPEAIDAADLYPLLVASMLDADPRIPGGAALFVRLRTSSGGFDPKALAKMSEREIEAARRVMPSPLRARVLFSNAKIFLELDARPGGFRAWLAAQPDPVASLCGAFQRLEPRAAVLFLRTLGTDAIAPDEPLLRVAKRLGWVPPNATGGDVKRAVAELASAVADRPGLVDLTLRRFADAVCTPEPQCIRCAQPKCPARRVESAVFLPE